MPNNYPYYQWYPGDWKAQASMLSLLTKGFWRELLDNMHLADRDYQVSGTVTEIGLSVGCLPDDARRCIDEIRDKEVADVTECNGIVTIVCRRLKREYQARKASSERTRKHRDNKKSDDNATPPSRESNAPRAPKTNNQDLKDTPEDKSSSVSSRKRSYRITFGYDEDYEFHGITEKDKKLWQECYPAINLDQELRTMRAWLKSNPKNRKIDVERFINSWLKRSQDRAPVSRQSQDEFSGEERDNATVLL